MINPRSAVGEIVIVFALTVAVFVGLYLVRVDSFTGADVAILARGGCPVGEHRQHVQGVAGGGIVDLSTCVPDAR